MIDSCPASGDNGPSINRHNSRKDLPGEKGALLKSLNGLESPRQHYKRPFDLSILIVSHVLLFPVWIVLWTGIALVIWLYDRGPVLYGQIRVSKDGKLFKVWKFRTMVVDAEQVTGPVWAKDQDRRVTRVGHILRRFRMDEMPQVINIMKGEMSLVGPRPERPELVEQFSKQIPEFEIRHRVRPGFAGLAQVRGKYSTSPRNKLRYDKLYIKKMGPWLDIKLLFIALFVVLGRSPY